MVKQSTMALMVFFRPATFLSFFKGKRRIANSYDFCFYYYLQNFQHTFCETINYKCLFVEWRGTNDNINFNNDRLIPSSSATPKK